jgi:hypothetical protein
MPNMSYCRFENTSQDLNDCLEALSNEEYTDLSTCEETGLRDLIQLCKEILEYEDEIIDFWETRDDNS